MLARFDKWQWHVVACAIIAAVVTPADPFSMLLVFFPLLTVWLTVRHFLKLRRRPSC